MIKGTGKRFPPLFSVSVIVMFSVMFGTIITSGRESIGARFNVNQSALNDRVRFNFNLNNNNFNDNIIYSRAMTSALVENPTRPVYNEDGSYYEFDNTLFKWESAE